ncbi:MAG: anti-sigma factor antagonist [Calditrichales bacterium]|nr:MAG: anti-sigma factor antagonist [Calditrichales bacterium]
MKFKDRIEDGIGVLILKGKLMGYPETDELHDEMKSFLGQKIKNIVIDANGVSWMNSMGVGSLMRCLTTIRNAGGDLRLARMSEKARSVFVITQLISVFKIFETVEEGIESFKSE